MGVNDSWKIALMVGVFVFALPERVLQHVRDPSKRVHDEERVPEERAPKHAPEHLARPGHALLTLRTGFREAPRPAHMAR